MTVTTQSIDIPAERVPPVATDMASSSKTVAGVLGFLTLICVIAAITALTDGKHRDATPRDSAEAAGHAVGSVLGAVFIVAIPGMLGFRAARNASRATRAAALAKQDPSYTWRLAGKYLIAVDRTGIPHPELSFRLNGKLHTMLLAVPRAEVRS